MKFWDILATPFAWIMRMCYQSTTWVFEDGSFVISLLLFALIMQILLCPFGIIQQRNMVKQAKMRPMEYLIRKKYAGRNDRATMQKMQNEIMELYQKEGYSPLKGCLPMLLQFVIILPLYQVVIKPLTHIAGLAKHIATIELCFRHDGSAINDRAKEVSLSTNILDNRDRLSEVFPAEGWSETLNENGEIVLEAVEGADATGALEAIEEVLAGAGGFFNSTFVPNVRLGSFDLGEMPFAAFSHFSALWFLLFIPVINLALMYVSQIVSKKLNPQQQLEQQQQQAGGGMLNSMKIMMWTMPLMTFFFTFMFPAAVGIYWIFRTLLSMLQQFILSRIFKMPKYSEEDLKRIEKEMKDAKKNQHRRPDIVYEGGEGKGYRSLHHIDDDE